MTQFPEAKEECAMIADDAGGYDTWDVGAQKGVLQPPFVVKWRRKWWRTLNRGLGQQRTVHHLTGVALLSADDVARVRALGRMPYGQRQCMDYLARAKRRFTDLPLLDPLRLPPALHHGEGIER